MIGSDMIGVEFEYIGGRIGDKLGPSLSDHDEDARCPQDLTVG
jgi:hypothetical protein